MSGAGCPACDGSWPAPTHRIVELPTTVAYLNEDQFFPGWTFLVLRRHATELWQLRADERATMIEEVTRVARALGAAFGAAKLNYELLGNQVAHIHWHLIPRLPGDPAPRQPAWTVPHDPRRLPAGEVTERIATIRRHLEA
ncbi:MAG TPA: HIT family protein [Candidatus Tectomicrobia bacterium]|nr:HIT family protein [Candidatus Tectomicrobia bacterium]